MREPSLHIQRDRWVIYNIEKDTILCGLAQNYTFKKVDDINNIAIKTYESKNRAESAFKNSWRKGEELLKSGKIIALNIIEEIGTRAFYKGE